MTPDTWKLIASIGGVLLTAVTGPLLWALRAESRNIRTEMKVLRTEMKLELSEMEKRLKIDMFEMEKRLNERIDTRLVHR